MSKGNTEQHTAQAPQSHSSPNRVEVSGDGQQGAPQSPGTPRPQSPVPGTRDQPSGNGTQDRTPTGTAKSSPSRSPPGPRAHEPERPEPAISRNCQPSAADRRRATGRSPSPPPTQQKHQPGRRSSRNTSRRHPPRRNRGRPKGRRRRLSRRCPLRRLSRPEPQPEAKPRRPPRQPSCVLHLSRRQGLHINRGPLGPYLCGIRRLLQHRNNPSGGAWGLAGRPSLLRRTRLLRLSSSNPGRPSRSRREPHPVARPRRLLRQVQSHRQDRRRVRRSSSARCLKTSLGARQVRGCGGRWPERGSRHPGRSPGHPQAPPGQPSIPPGPVRPGETTGRTPAAPGGAPPLAPPAGPQVQMPPGLVNPAARMPGAPAYPAAPVAVPVPAPGQQPSDWPTGRNQPVPAGSENIETEAHHAAKPKVGVARRTRKARLRLSRLDPWSVMKTSFLFSIAAGIMLVAAVYSVWTVLSTSQLFDSINEIVRSVVSTPGIPRRSGSRNTSTPRR